MAALTALPPGHLVLNRDVSDRAFRVWCWFDQLSLTRDGVVAVSYNEVAVTFGCSYQSAVRAVRELLGVGYLERLNSAPGTTGVYRTVHSGPGLVYDEDGVEW